MLPTVLAKLLFALTYNRQIKWVSDFCRLPFSSLLSGLSYHYPFAQSSCLTSSLPPLSPNCRLPSAGTTRSITCGKRT